MAQKYVLFLENLKLIENFSCVQKEIFHLVGPRTKRGSNLLNTRI